MSNTGSFLTNQFLLSMPALNDPFFTRSVIYICEHNKNGAIGLVINRPLSLKLTQVLKQMKIETDNGELAEQSVLCGGPVHPECGFVVHTPSGTWKSSFCMDDQICVTVSEDILMAIAKNEGPQEAIFSLGYASWTQGQLEQEIRQDCWLASPPSVDILFKVPFERRWATAMSLLGVDITKLAYVGGDA